MAPQLLRFARQSLPRFFRGVSTLQSNPYVKVHPNPALPGTYLLTLLPTSPPTPRLSLGTTSALPPSPSTFRENTAFLAVLNSVLADYAHEDPDLNAQAQAFAGPGGATLGSGGAFFGGRTGRKASASEGGGAGGASAQGGAGGAGRGGYVHLSDTRNPPDFGRIAWPEDILGSVEVDGQGKIVGRLQSSGTYRILTNEGILGLSPFLREKLVERLTEEETKAS